MVGTLVTLRDPLSLSALNSIVKSDEDVRGALSHLQSVIRVQTAPDEAARALHPSSVDFITNKKRCTDSHFLFDVRSREIFLAQRCHELMVGSLGQNVAGIEDETVWNIDVADFEGRVEEVLPIELRYARLHWALHTMAMEHAVEKYLSSMHEFTHGSLLN